MSVTYTKNGVTTTVKSSAQVPIGGTVTNWNAPSSGSSSSSGSSGGSSTAPLLVNPPGALFDRNTGQPIPPSGGSLGGGSSSVINIDSNPGQVLQPGQVYTYQGQTYTQPGAATPPTNVNNIVPTPDPTLPDTTPTPGNIYDSTGVTAGITSQNDAQIAEINQINKDRETAQKTNETILTKLMSLGSQNSTAQTRQDLSAQYGIQAKIAEIDSLTTDYNKLKSVKDAQVAKTQDVMGSMNFINNQTQQIERNAAPQLNELSANINSKAAILSQNQDLVNQAVQDATADKKYQMDLVTTFYQMNQDTINNLDSDYKLALQNYIDGTTLDYKNATDTANQVMELGMTYTKAGIKSTDTLDQAYAKIQSNSYTLDSANTQSLINDRNNTNQVSTYSVKNGDEGRYIADKLGLTLDTLMALNPGVNWNNLKVGQKLSTDTSNLKVPGSSSASGLNYADF